MQVNEVKWLKFPVGFMSSVEAIKMRSAQRGSCSQRDKLGCVWMELFDLAGLLDRNGLLIRGDRPLDAKSIASYLYRRANVVEYCLKWYLENDMLAIDGETGAYYINGWRELQSTEIMKRKRAKRVEERREAGGREDETHDAEEKKTEQKRKEENIKEETREETKEEDKARAGTVRAPKAGAAHGLQAAYVRAEP